MNKPILVEEENPYGRLDEASLKELSNEIPFRLPPEYVLYLRNFNGGKFVNRFYRSGTDVLLSTRIHNMYGLHRGPKYLRLQDLFRPWKIYDLDMFKQELRHFFVFADTATGEFLMFNLQTGAVCLFEANQIEEETVEGVSSTIKVLETNFSDFTDRLISEADYWNAEPKDPDFENRLRKAKLYRAKKVATFEGKS